MKPSRSISMGASSSRWPTIHGRKARNNGMMWYYEMAKNIKNSKAKPFPRNRKRSILIQRKFPPFRPQISRRTPSISIVFVRKADGWHPQAIGLGVVCFSSRAICLPERNRLLASGRRAAAENIADQIHGIADVDLGVAVGVTGTQRIRSRAFPEKMPRDCLFRDLPLAAGRDRDPWPPAP